MEISKKTFWRLIAILSGCFCIASILFAYCLTDSFTQKSFKYVVLIFCLFIIVSVIYQMIFPLDFRLYIVWTFLFACITAFYKSTALSVIIVFNGIFLGSKSGFFKKNKILKIIVGSVLYSASLISLLRFESLIYIDAYINFVGAVISFVLIINIYKYFFTKNKNLLGQVIQKENLDTLMEREKFSKRDRDILRSILAGDKYEKIALDNEISISYLKKRISFLYKKLGVNTQVDFLIKFQ